MNIINWFISSKCNLPSNDAEAFIIPVDELHCDAKEKLQNKMAIIAAHIMDGKGFAIQRAPASLEIHLVAQANQTNPSYLPVLDTLTHIVLKALKLGISFRERNLETIFSFCQKISKAHPISKDPVRVLSPDLFPLILRGISCQNLASLRTVTTLWNQPVTNVQIDAVNTQSLPLKKVLGEKSTAALAVDRLMKLTYADFTGFKDFDNACLERLTKNCPNLRHLLIPDSAISGDALKHLANVPNLLTLNIARCYQLEKDALKHLVHVKGLQILDLHSCFKLEEGMLQHLAHVPDLQSLNLRNCLHLKGDALKHLVYVLRLQTLNIAYCDQLEKDALKHLVHVKGLQILDFHSCYTLEEDMLKHLAHVPNLRSLNVRNCVQIRGDALKHLVYVPGLESLILYRCTIEKDALKHLVHVPNLQSLDISLCKQLERDALKHLVYIPSLKSLIIHECELESYALIHLVHVPGLQSLNISRCSRLEYDALKHLIYVPSLKSLILYGCDQLDLSKIPKPFSAGSKRQVV